MKLKYLNRPEKLNINSLQEAGKPRKEIQKEKELKTELSHLREYRKHLKTPYFPGLNLSRKSIPHQKT